MGSCSLHRLALVPFLLAVACGSGGNAATPLLEAPKYAPPNQTKASVRASSLRPLIVEWPNADRAALETHAKKTLVPVRYVDGQMEVLTTCSLGTKYGYVPTEPKLERVVMRTADDVSANIPVHAARFAGQLATSGELVVNMTIAGRYQTGRRRLWIDELGGDCTGVTHVVTALTVGAFDFFTAARASVGGGGSVGGAGASAQSAAGRETLNKDGDEAACAKGRSTDLHAPEGCQALVRLELMKVELPDALRSLAPCHESSLDACEKRCDAGSPVACATLARMHALGEGAPQDGARAVSLNERACNAGYVVGCMNLGLLYVTGKRVEKNVARGRELIEEACRGGLADACGYLGTKYRTGEEGFLQDPLHARDLYLQACRNGQDLGCEAVRVMSRRP